MTMDMLDLHPSYLQEIREIAQGQTGFYIQCENYFAYQQQLTSPSLSLTISQPISHLKDIFIVPRRSSVDSTYSIVDSNHNQFVSYRFTVGTNPLTINPVTGLTESYIETRILECPRKFEWFNIIKSTTL